MLRFNDRENWLDMRIQDVKDSYFVPEEAKHGIAVDVGGNVGAFSMVHHDNFNRIIAFEPSTESIHKYIINTRMYDNVKAYRYAVSDQTGKYLKLKQWNVRERKESGNASTIDSPEWDCDEYEEVMSICLEDIFYIWNIERINYLKVDCEGGEYDFLICKDMSKIDYLSIEIHKQLNGRDEELKVFLNKYFDLIEHKESGRLKQYIATYKNKLL
jgi:FkbM family methyltransferase